MSDNVPPSPPAASLLPALSVKWTCELAQQISIRPPVVVGDVAVVPMVTQLAWLQLSDGRARHLTPGALNLMAVVPWRGGVAAVRQDGASSVVEAFSADATLRWRVTLDLGVGPDGLHVHEDRLLLVGTDKRGLQGAWLDDQGAERGRMALPTADVRVHDGRLFGALAMPVDGRTGLFEIADGDVRWLCDIPAFQWAMSGTHAVVDSWDGWAASSEILGVDLARRAVTFRDSGGPNSRLLPAQGCVAYLETAPGGPVVVLRDLAGGAPVWRSKPVGADEPGLFGRCSGAAQLLDRHALVWLQSRGFVVLSRRDGRRVAEFAMKALPPGGATPTAFGLLARDDVRVTLLELPE